MPSRALALLAALAGCIDAADSRESRILNSLADDSYVASLRDPTLAGLKLKKMQRGPYEWLRGTASLYWRDLTEPGAPRPATAFGSPESSRVLLVGDPHVENVGTFRAADATLFVDWNDFDGTGYGPYWGDLRRLGASFAVVAHLVAPDDAAYAAELAHIIAARYAQIIAKLAAGTRIGTLGAGADPLFDKAITKAYTRGIANYAVNEIAPVMNGVRVLATGDLEAVGSDGVIEDRVVELGPEEAAWIDHAIAQWRTSVKDDVGHVLLRARRIGSGISSYAVYRFNVVLSGPTDSPDDDRIVEIKETRDGVIVPGVPRLASSGWDTPAIRAVATQRELQGRPDGDRLLGHAEVGGLSLKVRDREAFQRGINVADLVELGTADRDALRDLADRYGELLAHAHGDAPTQDGVLGYAVIAPLLAGREAQFADEIGRLAAADASQIIADHELMKDRDLGALVNARQ